RAVVGTKRARADARERRCRRPQVATLLSKTVLQREFPLHVVCSWLGNSPRIAQQGYLLVTEDDFAKAAGVAKDGESLGHGGMVLR
ncbi:MAG: hypothetical protein ACKOAU_00455, partial [Pirellula sp.]